MKKILVVDDDEFIQMLYAEELSEEGYEVVTTGDGAHFLQRVREEDPDLILLDIQLGQYDGLCLLEEMRNAGYHTPVILCSAYPDFKGDLRAIAADYYVVKSSNLEELKSKIRVALQVGPPFPPETEASQILPFGDLAMGAKEQETLPQELWGQRF